MIIYIVIVIVCYKFTSKDFVKKMTETRWLSLEGAKASDVISQNSVKSCNIGKAKSSCLMARSTIRNVFNTPPSAGVTLWASARSPSPACTSWASTSGFPRRSSRATPAPKPSSCSCGCTASSSPPATAATSRPSSP